MKRIKTILFPVLSVLLLLIGTVSLSAAIWYIAVFGNMGFDAILFTLFSDLNGAAGNLISGYLLGSLLPALAVTAGLSVFLLWKRRKMSVEEPTEPSADPAEIPVFDEIPQESEKKPSRRIYPFSRTVALLIALGLFIGMLAGAMGIAGVYPWLYGRFRQTSLYEDEYVDPQSVQITFPETKRNLIYVFLESMETTFFPEEYGGAMPYGEEVIPELRQLAEENINFSQNDAAGGFSQVKGANWTIASMVAQTSGIPLCLPLKDSNDTPNTYGNYSLFLPGVTCLSDILHENGYYQTLMVGSDASFGGRAKYYSQHGADKIYDIYTAKQDGIVPSDYWVWWGMEDEHLFEYAKRELTAIAAGDQPFAFTMLTVDTHHIGGYTCEQCGDTFPAKYENVYACSGRQVAEFVEWIKQQPFYENTTVILCGDHCSMDAQYMSAHVDSDYTRRVYNCVINAPVSAEHTKNRECCAFDWFPTTLTAMGCTVPGGRLGLGTDLFSGQETLAEKYGIDELNTQIQMTSSYYENEFLYGDRTKRNKE